MGSEPEQRWKVQVGAETTEAACDAPAGEERRGILVLAHGAGGSMDTRSLLREANVCRSLGLAVVRFNFLYRAVGRKYPDRMPQLMACYSAVVDSLGRNAGTEQTASRSLFLGGHSMGGRTATMMAAEGFPCDGLILFSYPLHPPGKFDQLRAEHLPRIKVPVLCFNGTRDDFMRRDIMDRLQGTLPATWTHHWIEHADHSLSVRKKSGRTVAEVDAEINATLENWLALLIGPRRKGARANTS
jgi:hypothetical protein